MDDSDRKEFVRILNGLAAIKRVDLTKEAYELWWLTMQDWTIDEFRVAAGFLLKNCQFMPAPYDFEELRKESETSAHEGWSLALNHANGAWKDGVLGDATIDKVVAMLGGYSVIALTNTNKLGFLERRFIDAYSDLSHTICVRKALPNLVDSSQLQSVSPAMTQGIETD